MTVFVLQQMANRSYLKSQKLKETSADRQKLLLLEKENDVLKKEKNISRADQEKLTKSVEQCKAVSAERDLLKEELSELKTAAQAVVNLIDPVKEVASTSKTLAECLRGAPQRTASYLTENSKGYIAQVLGLVKSYWPSARIALLGDGMSVECDDDKFTKYVEEAEPIAEQIVKMLEQ